MATLYRLGRLPSARFSALSAAFLCMSAAAFGASPPNILLLMADQFRGDCLDPGPDRVVRTPNLDRLASQGARFRCAYSSTPSCTPARAGLLTGLSPWRHGMLGYYRVAQHYPHEMPQMLRDAGYYTLAVGKLHYYPQRNLHGFNQALLDEEGRRESIDFRSDYRSWLYSVAPTLNPDATGLGWNDYRARAYKLPEEFHPTRWTGDVAVRFLKEYQRSEPFFLMVSFARPHSPYDPPERFLKMYEHAAVPPPALGDWAARNDVKIGPRNPSPWRGNFGPETPIAARRAYYGNVTFIDEQIGRILAALTDRGLLENTLILFTADHGDMLGDHYLWRKTYAYEPSARIPMLIRWPNTLSSTQGAPRGQVRAEPVELRDVLPTFLDAAGIKAPALQAQAPHHPQAQASDNHPQAQAANNQPEAQASKSQPGAQARNNQPEPQASENQPEARAGGAFDGRTLLDLVRATRPDSAEPTEPSPAWRPFIDLEHANCYAGAGWWNALTDGHWKYILQANTGQEQLFDLQKDPHELTDLAPNPACRETLETWRARLLEHLSERGQPYVHDGKLQAPRPNLLLSPNYPPDEPETPAATPPAPRRAPRRPARRAT